MDGKLNAYKAASAEAVAAMARITDAASAKANQGALDAALRDGRRDRLSHVQAGLPQDRLLHLLAELPGGLHRHRRHVREDQLWANTAAACTAKVSDQVLSVVELVANVALAATTGGAGNAAKAGGKAAAGEDWDPYSLDPTGIAAIVKAYNHSTCGR